MKSTRGKSALEAALVAFMAVGATSASAYTVRPPEPESYLGHPFKALIRIDLDPGEAPPDTIELASPDEMSRRGLDEYALHSTTLSVRREDGEHSVNVYLESPNDLLEPMFAILLDVRRGKLRTLHQFTLMLDPEPVDRSTASGRADLPADRRQNGTQAKAQPAPESAAPVGAAASTPAGGAVASAAIAPAPAPVLKHLVHRHRVATRPAHAAAHWTGGASYGPVARGESLSEIALKVRANRNTRLYDIVRALVSLNPKATRGRESFVAEGAVLRLPSELTTVAALPAAQPAVAVAAKPAPAVAVTSPSPAPAMAVTSAQAAATATTVAAPDRAVSHFQLANSLGSGGNAATQAAAASTQAAAPATAVAAPSTATATQTIAAPVAGTAAQATAQAAAAAPAVAAVPQAETGAHLSRGVGAWLAALLALCTAVLLWWARRERALNRSVNEARVLAVRDLPESATAMQRASSGLASERELQTAAQTQAKEISPQERIELLKQAYTARGKQFRDSKN